MMSRPIEELYFNWLCAKVLPPNAQTHHALLEVLHRTEFQWKLDMDGNRAADGVELRLDFLREREYSREPGWFDCPCSVLEMLIAFAQVARFQTDIPAADWFWTMIHNLGLDEYRRVAEDDIPDIEEILNRFMWREYRPNGEGGLFPMRLAQSDQREVEIWYQFCNYVRDQHLI